MKRCLPSPPTSRRQFVAGLSLLAFCMGAATAAHAQQSLPRNFPDKALRGTLVVTQPPAITMDGVAMRLSPGARIKNTNNTLVLSGALVGQELVVNYTLNGGLVHEVWILDAEEAAQKRARAADLAN